MFVLALAVASAVMFKGPDGEHAFVFPTEEACNAELEKDVVKISSKGAVRGRNFEMQCFDEADLPEKLDTVPFPTGAVKGKGDTV